MFRFPTHKQNIWPSDRATWPRVLLNLKCRLQALATISTCDRYNMDRCNEGPGTVVLAFLATTEAPSAVTPTGLSNPFCGWHNELSGGLRRNTKWIGFRDYAQRLDIPRLVQIVTDFYESTLRGRSGIREKDRGKGGWGDWNTYSRAYKFRRARTRPACGFAFLVCFPGCTTYPIHRWLCPGWEFVIDSVVRLAIEVKEGHAATVPRR